MIWRRVAPWGLALLFLFMGATPALAASGAVAGTVSLRTEYDVYPANTALVLGYLENSSGQEAGYDGLWQLEYRDGNRWRAVKEDWWNTENTFGYQLDPGDTKKLVFDLRHYADRLKVGEYRIKINIHQWSQSVGGEPKQFQLTAAFRTQAPVDFPGNGGGDPRGEDWRYVDITPRGVLLETSARVYRHAKTFDTVVVDEGRRHAIAAGEGGRGVEEILYLRMSGREYMLYTYSRELAGRQYSAVGAFDFAKGGDVFLSRRFYDRQLTIGWDASGSSGEAVCAVYEAAADGGAGKRLGSVRYADGVFAYSAA